MVGNACASRIATFHHATLRVAPHRYATREPLGTPSDSRAFNTDELPYRAIGATLRRRGLSVGRRPMQKVNRRSAVALGLAAASAAMVKPAASQTTDIVGKDTTPYPGVVMRVYSETPALIPGFKNVQLRDIIMQPGSKTAGPPMMNAMVCHITEGELRIEQEGKTFTAKKNFVWTCNKGTKEQAYNDGNVVGIMRITDLMA